MTPIMVYKDLYMEIMVFLGASGGAYQNIDIDTYRDIIDALFDGRYRVTRDDNGNLISFTSWWMIHEADVEAVKNGGRPKDISTGPIFYVADHAGIGTVAGLIQYLRITFGNRDCCFHHKFKHPSQFRYRRKTEAHSV